MISVGIHAEIATKLGFGAGLDCTHATEDIEAALNEGTLIEIEIG